MSPGFWEGFLSNGLATLLGAVLGIPIALWLNRVFERRRLREAVSAEREQRREVRNQVLRLLHEALERNLRLLEQMEREVPRLVVYYNVDATILEATAALKYQMVDDMGLNRMIDGVRYGLSHLHRKVELALSSYYGSVRTMIGFNEMFKELQGSIVASIPGLKAEITAAMTAINHQLGLPLDTKRLPVPTAVLGPMTVEGAGGA